MAGAARLCLIEDDTIMGESLADRFELEGFEVDWFARGVPALQALRSGRFDAIISDVRLPDVSGEDLFLQARRELPALPPVVFITAYASVDRAVQMLKHGAFDYVTKPFDIGELVAKVRDAVGAIAVGPATSEGGPLGVSAPMRALAQIAPRIAARARTVLIAGESGAGKEVLARHLHALAFSDAAAPFIAVNCGAIPEGLLESALFGHERGAFTGAQRRQRGYFEQASGGTLFLDEIGDIPPLTQVRLLRALQERKVQRLGSEAMIDLDLRLIGATHRDLKALVGQGRFREDLYYRINVVQLHVPPLRDRLEDVAWLAGRFLDEQAALLHEAPRVLSAAARAQLIAHDWPGNARELRNRIERACALANEAVLSASDLFPEREPLARAASSAPSLEGFVRDAECVYLEQTLRRFDGRIGVSAAALGISRKTLWEKMRRHGLRAPDADPGRDDAH